MTDATSSIKFHVHLGLGATLAKQKDLLLIGEKNTRNIKHCTKGSNVAKHAWTFDHVIDFNNSKIIDKANNRNRNILESWHTAKTVGVDNNLCPLKTIPYSLEETLIFLSIFNILFCTHFYLLIYAKSPLYFNFFRFYSSHVFIRRRQQFSLSKARSFFKTFYQRTFILNFWS